MSLSDQAAGAACCGFPMYSQITVVCYCVMTIAIRRRSYQFASALQSVGELMRSPAPFKCEVYHEAC